MSKPTTRKRHPRLFSAIALLLALPVAAEPLQVGVSVAPIGWLVERIGGDNVEVQVLARPGDSAETFQPGDAQVSRLMRASLFVRVGLPFEESPAFRALAGQSTLEVIDLRDGLDLLEHDHGGGGDHDDHHHAGEHEEHGVDPHHWLSPRRLVAQTATLERALAARDPENADAYRRGAAEVAALLRTLDADLERRLAPYRGRAFFVHHPEWSYWAADYGLRQLAIEHEGKEPSEAELTRLIELARREDVRTLFLPPQMAGRGTHALAEAIGARVVPLDGLGPDLPALLLKAADQVVASFGPRGPS